MYKFRTMRVGTAGGECPITGKNDRRLFAFGVALRRLKIDELPQLLNVIKGDMSIVGPRPESPDIVRDHYSERQLETLKVLPGLASPGSIYNYTHGENLLNGGDPEELYVERLLPTKLALEHVYVANASFCYDMKVIMRTVWVVLSIALGRKRFPLPPEMDMIDDGEPTETDAFRH